MQIKTTLATLISIFALFFHLSAQTNCGQTIEPVCGDDGNTYINSCYAQAAGVTNFTTGLCYSECIDFTQINPNASCGTVYEPVCGCNGITYLNACVAEASGVTSYSTGQCGSFTCYNPKFVIYTAQIVFDWNTGILTEACDNISNPVCGCDGLTYLNPCMANASGITNYTFGICDSICVNPNNFSKADLCPIVDDPVCGCNDVTYGNACLADAAGVASYTNGPCQTSNWCASATLIQCGDFLSSETNSGGTNFISQYPGCLNANLVAPEKIYKIHKTTTGDLQIGLEIISPGLDLDLFLLNDQCNTINCLKSSTSNNTQSNNEGILLSDAPIGTYYIVVDGQYANSIGTYKLEVSCGYLDCSSAESITCGQQVSSTNLYGDDNVSLYSQGNYFNVENNGPEVVYTFSMVAAGNATIDLSNFNQNLELFLLSACDGGSLIGHSTSSGNIDESISRYLQPGTYYIVVDGYNGAVSQFNLQLSCPAYCVCALNATFNTTPANCGQSNGKVIINTTGGTAPYQITWSGPVCGTTTSYGSTCNVIQLPAGTYTFTVVDANGCSITQIVTVANAGSNFDFTLNANNSGCGVSGSINVAISSGTAPYQVYVSGPANFNLTKYTSNFILNNLPAGTYLICIVDSYGCSRTHSITIAQSSGNYNVVMSPSPARCETKGKVHVSISGGQPIFLIHVQGPVSGTASSGSNSFNIVNLPAGTYIIKITDANGCQVTQTVTVGNEELDITAQPANGSCGSSGGIDVFMNNGVGPYQITWNGPVSSNITTSNNPYTINNLPNGTYHITVKDANWCMDNQTVYLNSTGGGLNVVAQTTNAGCNMPGSIGLDILNGTAPYQITWTGPSNGSTSSTTNWFDINNLPAGAYTVKVTDINGCMKTISVVIQGGSGNLNIIVTSNPASCNSTGTVGLDIQGGTAPYLVMWAGPVNGSTSTSANWFDITNLPAGSYWIKVTDANGCIKQKSIVVGTSGSSFDLSFNTMNGSCSMLGSIWLTMSGGTAPFNVTWTGPVNGSASTTNHQYDINDLPAGTYYVKVTDANGCMRSISTTIELLGSSFSITLTSENESCGNLGSIWVNMSNGVGPYTITWSGTASGTVNTNSNQFNIVNLAAGPYTINVVDENGCSQTKNVSVYNSGSSLSFTASANNAACGSTGNVDINVTQGTPPFMVSWTGPSNGGFTITDPIFSLANLQPGNYAITIIDANNCEQTKSVTVAYSVVEPEASFTYNLDGLTIDFVNNSIGDNFYWTFGDGMSSTLVDPAHFYCEPGTFEVCLIATNACGSDTSCISITLDYPTNAVVLDVGNAAGENNALILLPIYVYNADNVLSLTGSIESSNLSIGAVQGVTAGKINPTYNLNDGTFNYFTTNPVNLSDGDILFYINVLMQGNSGDQTTIQITNNPISIEFGALGVNGPEVLAHYAVHGLAKIITPNVCYGLLHDMSIDGINDVEMTISGENFHTTTMTDITGKFDFNNAPLNKELILKASKMDNIMNGLSTQALYRGQQFILGMAPDEIHSPYQIIAADVNCNNSFTGLDLFVIQQVLVGNQNSFPGCPDWIFINDDYIEFSEFTTYNVFNYSPVDTFTITDFVSSNFVGIKSGDILGRANPKEYIVHPNIKDMDDLELFTESIAIELGETREVAIYASNFNQISSMQFTLSFDKNEMQYVDFVPSNHDDLKTLALGNSNAADGKITLSWFNLKGSATNLDQHTPLFTLRFKALSQIDDVYSRLKIDANGISPEAFTPENFEYNVDLNQSLIISSSNNVGVNDGIELFQNSPNPASNFTYISFYLPRAMDVSLEIINEMGKRVLVHQDLFSAGQHEFPVTTDFVTGTYYYTLKTSKTTLTKKMVVIRRD